MAKSFNTKTREIWAVQGWYSIENYMTKSDTLPPSIRITVKKTLTGVSGQERRGTHLAIWWSQAYTLGLENWILENTANSKMSAERRILLNFSKIATPI